MESGGVQQGFRYDWAGASTRAFVAPCDRLAHASMADGGAQECREVCALRSLRGRPPAFLSLYVASVGGAVDVDKAGPIPGALTTNQSPGRHRLQRLQICWWVSHRSPATMSLKDAPVRFSQESLCAFSFPTFFANSSLLPCTPQRSIDCLCAPAPTPIGGAKPPSTRTHTGLSSIRFSCPE
jgi:hypothetical protein